jgi:hypothetical protein
MSKVQKGNHQAHRSDYQTRSIAPLGAAVSPRQLTRMPRTAAIAGPVRVDVFAAAVAPRPAGLTKGACFEADESISAQTPAGRHPTHQSPCRLRCCGAAVELFNNCCSPSVCCHT